jgi:sulfide:quinone oxidoreductase
MGGSVTMVLGGGFGGAAAALTVRRLLPSPHQVVLIDRTRQARLCGVNPLIAAGARPVGGLTRSLDVAAAEGVEVVTSEIDAIDVAGRRVVAGGRDRAFDHLVVALGADYDWAAVPGSADADTFYHYDGAVRLSSRLGGFERGTVAVVVAGGPVKCPPASIEGALLIEEWARRAGIRDRIEVHLATPEPAPLAVAGPAAAQTLVTLLAERRITLHTSVALTDVGNSGSEARFADGSAIAADVLVVVPAHRAPAVVEGSGLTGGGRWVPVDPATLETETQGVFAIGDVNVVPTATAVLPKAGVFASGQGRTVGSLIASRILDGDPPPAYDGAGSCFLAVSSTEAAWVGGTFLGAAGPDVGLGAVGAEATADMAGWEQDWQAFRI